MKILIAEDDPVSIKILQFTLEHWGHEIIVAGDGAEAWEHFDREPVRVIISDWMMPGLDGLELCQKVRTRPKSEYTYFILLTAIHTGRENLRKAMDAGIDDFVAKPIDREAVFMRLRVAERILGFTTEIKLLKELIPICMYCKRVRDDSDYWQQVETYIHQQTGSQFSHGICPDCFEKQVTQLPGRTGLKIAPPR
ncbi:MAG: response regulator [Chthoniobacteraceae bacterium]